MQLSSAQCVGEGGGAAGGRVVTGDIRGGPAEQASGHSVGPLRKPRPGLNMLNKVSPDGRLITISLEKRYTLTRFHDDSFSN